ncbi:MAG: hypothetical protein HZA13_01915 [Nitrospirae bacterium]|nr:hypothetical protein [Nitrospirota bacterium]
MAEVRIKVSNDLFQKLPKKQEDIQKVLRLGLKLLKTPRQKPARSIVDETFASLSIKNHKLIKEVIEQTRYGE